MVNEPAQHQGSNMAMGTLSIMIAQVIFRGSGYLIHVGLARIVSAEEYGRFGVVLSILMITQIFLNRGIPEVVSKLIAEGRDAREVKQKALRLQFLYSMILFSAVFLLASSLAKLLNDKSLTSYIRFAALLIPVTALFTIFRGVLNGFRNFGKTASADTINALVRLGSVFLLMFLGFGLYGAIGGYILGSLGALCFTVLFSRKKQEGKAVSSKELISFSAPMVGFAVSYVLVLNLDLLFVKSFLDNQDEVGYYTAAKAVSSVIFGIVMALSFTLLPSISKSYARKDMKQSRSYINESIRYLLLILIPGGILVALTSDSLLKLFFPNDYAEAASVLSVLIFGTIFLSLFVILASVINGVGKPRIALGIGLFMLVVDFVLNNYLVRSYGMLGGAFSMLISAAIGLFLAGIVVFTIFDTVISAKSLFRIFFASVIIGSLLKMIGLFFTLGSSTIIPVYAILFVIYFGILVCFNEIKESEIQYLKMIVLKKND